MTAPDEAARAAATQHKKRRGNKKGAPRPSIARELSAIADDDVLLTANEVCQFFGGPTRPFDIATIYRGCGDGTYPLPIKVGPRAVRWLLSECRQARAKMIAARPQPAGTEGA